MGSTEVTAATSPADRPPTADTRPPTADTRPPIADHRPPITDPHPPITDARPRTDHGHPPTDHGHPRAARPPLATTHLRPPSVDGDRPVIHGVPRIGIQQLQLVLAEHWQAADRERLGDWTLRAAGGFTSRAKSVLTVGDPGMPLPKALLAVRDWYAARGLPATASVAGPAGPPLGRAAEHLRLGADFAADGWQPMTGAGALVLVAPLEPLRSAGSAAVPDGLSVHLASAPDPGWLSRFRYRGQDPPPDAVGLLLSAPGQIFCSIRDGSRTAAVARGSFGSGWLGVTAVEVDPRYRRRGLARSILAVLADWGASVGAETACLQVGDANAAALTLYAATGFAVHHRYDYLRVP